MHLTLLTIRPETILLIMESERYGVDLPQTINLVATHRIASYRTKSHLLSDITDESRSFCYRFCTYDVTQTNVTTV